MELPVLTTARIALRPFEHGDLIGRYVSWLNDPQTVRYSEQRHRRHTRATCESYWNAMGARGDWFLAIVRRAGEPRHIGSLSVAFDLPNGTADMAILIGAADARGEGLGLEAWTAAQGNGGDHGGKRGKACPCPAFRHGRGGTPTRPVPAGGAARRLGAVCAVWRPRS